jgi:nitrous-oxide reductase
VIGMKDALHVQVPLGLGPLHTQYDSKACVAYTSLYVDSPGRQVGLLRRQGARQDQRALQHRPPDDHGGRLHQAGRQVSRRAEQAGHRPLRAGRPAASAEPPADRHRNDKMQLLYDMPLPLGEPHYVVAIDATS